MCAGGAGVPAVDLADGALGPVGTPVSSVSKSEGGYCIAVRAGLPGSARGSIAEAPPERACSAVSWPALEGHKRAAARLVRLREGAVTLPVLAFLGAQA